MAKKIGETKTYIPRDTSADPAESFNDPRCHEDADADYVRNLRIYHRDGSYIGEPTRSRKAQD